MKDQSRQKLEVSLDWIRSHPFSTNHEVPEELRHSWMYDRGEEEPTGLQIAAFVFGYCQLRLIETGPEQRHLSVSASEIAELFQLWQLKLGLSELRHRTDLKSDPLPLFKFPSKEEIQFWTDDMVGS